MSKASEWLEKHKATEAARNRAIEEAGAAHPEVPPPSFVHDGKYNVFVDDCGFLRCNYICLDNKDAIALAEWIIETFHKDPGWFYANKAHGIKPPPAEGNT